MNYTRTLNNNFIPVGSSHLFPPARVSKRVITLFVRNSISADAEQFLTAAISAFFYHNDFGFPPGVLNSAIENFKYKLESKLFRILTVHLQQFASRNTIFLKVNNIFSKKYQLTCCTLLPRNK